MYIEKHNNHILLLIFINKPEECTSLGFSFNE